MIANARRPWPAVVARASCLRAARTGGRWGARSVGNGANAVGDIVGAERPKASQFQLL